MRGFFAGFLLLVALEAIVSSQQAAARTGSLLTLVGSIVDHVLDPTVPAIGDHRTGSSGATTSGSADTSGGGQIIPAAAPATTPKHAPAPSPILTA